MPLLAAPCRVGAVSTRYSSGSEGSSKRRVGALLASCACSPPRGAIDSRSHDIAVSLTPEQQVQLQTKATADVRSVSSYIARLIVGDLGRG
jgi:hypothetical protein